MSKPRYGWWPYAKNMIRDYPKLCREWEELKTISATANYDQVGHGSGISKPTEQVALRLLSETKQKEFDAVRGAVQETQRGPDGEEKVKLIRERYWRRCRRNLYGAARMVGIEESTAWVWHGDFIRLVAVYYGLLSREEFDEIKKKRVQK